MVIESSRLGRLSFDLQAFLSTPLIILQSLHGLPRFLLDASIQILLVILSVSPIANFPSIDGHSNNPIFYPGLPLLLDLGQGRMLQNSELPSSILHLYSIPLFFI